MTRANTLVRVAALLILAEVLTGCMSFNPRSLRQMENALRESNPDMEFASTMKFGLGALTMDLVDFAIVHDDNVDLSKIGRADIGIYELRKPLDVNDFQMPQGTDRNCPRREVILRVKEEHEHVEMAACIRDEKITGFSIFVLDAQEIVVINTRGDFKALISAAVRSHGPARRRMVAQDPAGAEAEGAHAHEDIHIHGNVHMREDVDIHEDLQVDGRTRSRRAGTAAAPQS